MPGFLGNLFVGRVLSGLQKIVSEINPRESELEKLSDEELLKKTSELRERILKNPSELQSGDVIAESFALAREAAKRTLRQRHFDVQLMGGLVLHQGKIAEMMTGEGKTLASTSAVFLNALAGKGTHVVTVNDYLAKRDTIWMGQIYSLLGLKIGCLTHETAFLYQSVREKSFEDKNREEIDQKRDELGGFKVFEDFLKPVSRQEAYAADITYGTNHEFGFDYLRDNLAARIEEKVQRGHYYAIIDEVDSILIDEARTPLIISAPDFESSKLYKVFAKVVQDFVEKEDYETEEKRRTVDLTQKGIDKVEAALSINNLFSPENMRLVHFVQQSLRAKVLFQKDRDYIVKAGQVIIVDEFTGRTLPGRRYSAGLHQALEAKEGVPIQQESKTVAQITIQNYFRLYQKLAGMTGTAQTSAEEFHKVYNLEVISIPTNKPMVRKDLPDVIFRTVKGKQEALIREIKERHEKGQPILMGTPSISKNEELARLLDESNIPYRMLNAKDHEREGEVIAQAGKLGAVTVATNMAGRGVDIVFGGNPPDPEEARKVKEAGGLHVIGTERHEARRIDNQLRGRAGRQGDPGSSQFFLSLEDDLLRIFGGEKMKKLMQMFDLPEDQPLESGLLSKSIAQAQAKVEGLNFDLRHHLLEYDDVLNRQRDAVYKKREELLKSSPISARILDSLWMRHLDNLEALRESVGIRAYGQKDPLIEYKQEAHSLFQSMMGDFEQALEVNKEQIKNLDEKEKMPGFQPGKKIGRNDPCPCGSGKKYKKCHGK